MGQKVNPKVVRIGTTQTWSSRWFSRKDFAKQLRQDVEIKSYLKKKLRDALVASIEVERFANNVNVIISAAKPGIIIGRAGVGVEDLKKELLKKFLADSTAGKSKVTLNINIQEVRKPYLNAQIVVQNMISDIEKRIPFRRVMKQAMARVQKEGAQGVKVMVGGRLNGAEIARQEMLSNGKIPLHTLRADIDYARGTAFTTYGAIGIKVWIYKGEVFKEKKEMVAVGAGVSQVSPAI